MTKLISPRIFFESGDILDFSQLLVDDVFQLLGSSLKERIAAILKELGVTDSPVIHGQVHPQAIIEGPVYIAEGAVVGPTAYIQGPTYIGPKAEVRHGAFIRGTAIIGEKAVVGHTTEVKGSIFGRDAKAGHFAYVGDSILGDRVNLGAGTKLANLKLRGDEVKVKHPDTGDLTASGLRKLGAILGHDSQTGCNAVLSPGTMLLPKTAVLPCVHFHGTLTKGFAK
ncbi:glucose-1-phosphate thymidylyltransferase [Pseudobacteriovorax antillogorgiicola]|uniref:Mannose-1-phosphate guanyltransferase C-terminal domain-containing protein n=1 Tax=Pseudobacteriovorax antillogorgiicola TaxID=1513793 RepID=A0A1Y6BUT4_9BACT|nr:glucose-1-phosphate thymidylyltransferase [Pseudobacteriovorax antillogorgiicola]TCS53780.1 hypothetical protein EDD56_10789 [Pseudobacteriovorax antillogorgiicola]SMF22353.1 hypothetical protein SAMN06296036_107183 [Pseudobacteriovorax antillogorgiicola]